MALHGRASRTIEQEGLWLIGLLGAGAAAYAYLFVAPLLFYGDNYAYLLLGRAWSMGLGHVSIWTGVLEPHAQYPPGYPMLIGALTAVGLGSVTALKLTNGVLLAASVGLLYGWSARVLADRRVALLACAFVAFNVALLRFASLVMSEVPFIAATLLAFYALARSREAGKPLSTDGWFWLALAATIAAFYIRSVGVALALALGAGFAADRQWRRAVVAGGVTFAAWVPWWWRGRALDGDYSKYFASAGEPGDAQATVAALAGRVAGNVERYLTGSFLEAMAPSLQPVMDLSPDLAAVLSAVLLILAGVGWRYLKAGHAVVAVYIGMTTLVYLIWPVHWNTYRFVLPTVPLLTVLATWGGLVAAGRVVRTPDGTPRAPGTPAPILVALPVLLLVLPGLYVGKRWDGRHPSTLESRHRQAVEWLQTHVPENGPRLAASREATLYYLAGRHTAMPRIGRTAEETIQMMREDGFGFVLVSTNAASHPMQTYLVPIIEAHPEQFELLESLRRPAVKEGAYPFYTALYRILPEPEADEAAAYGP